MYLDALDLAIARISASGVVEPGTSPTSSIPCGIVDASGTLQDQINYDGFGNVILQTSPTFGDSFQFLGYQHDSALGLDYNLGRYYDPTTGRWNNQDVSDENPYQIDGNDPEKKAPPPQPACGVASITIQLNGTPAAASNRLGIYWNIIIKGTNLKMCEYTQFISNEVSMWDTQGTALTQEQVLAAYKDSRITYSKATNPFAKDVKDDGFGKGESWEQFTSDTEQTAKDHHVLNVPTYKDGDARKNYAFSRKVDLVDDVREKATKTIVKEEKWGYEFRNYTNPKPKSPVSSDTIAGIYTRYGITGAIDDIDHSK